MHGGYNTGRHRAFQDWIRGGDFANPYDEGSPEWDGYERVVRDQEHIERDAERAEMMREIREDR